jgi:hypothetical protein
VEIKAYFSLGADLLYSHYGISEEEYPWCFCVITPDFYPQAVVFAKSVAFSHGYLIEGDYYKGINQFKPTDIADVTQTLDELINHITELAHYEEGGSTAIYSNQYIYINKEPVKDSVATPDFYMI